MARKKTQKRIYLDYAAATPVDPRVFAAMKRYFSGAFGNASSIHLEGVEAKRLLPQSGRMPMRLSSRPAARSRTIWRFLAPREQKKKPEHLFHRCIS